MQTEQIFIALSAGIIGSVVLIATVGYWVAGKLDRKYGLDVADDEEKEL